MKTATAKKRKSLSRIQRWLNTFWAWQPTTKLLAFNQHAFTHLYVIANLLLALELVTYRGFTFRYLFLDARVMMMVAVLSFLVIFGQQLKKAHTLPGLTSLVLELNKLSIIPLLLINYLLVSLDIYYYPNYVYSKFHINTNNLQLILSFNVLIILLQIGQRSQSVALFIWQRMNWKAGVNVLFLLAVGSFLLPNIQLVSKWMYDAGIRVIRTTGLSWEERFVYLNGGERSTGWITYYTQFVNRHVAERGVIFIPPQKESWQMEGNPYYLRWFIYPRFTVQSQDLDAPIPPEAEYVLIDNGAWPGMTEYGWPRMFIPADKIVKMVFIDRDTREEKVVIGQDYDPKTMSHKWGVIQLKR